MLPTWYSDALARRDRPEGLLELTAAFLSAPVSEQDAVRAAWAPRTTWATSNPWRLAASGAGPGSSAERIAAALLYQALVMSASDDRDAILGLAILFNSAALAGLDPVALFERVAAAFPDRTGESLRRFAARRPEDRSLGAFRLRADPDPSGGFAIRRDG